MAAKKKAAKKATRKTAKKGAASAGKKKAAKKKAAKKAAAKKKSTAKKRATKKGVAKKTAKRVVAKQAPVKTAAKKTAAKKTAAKKATAKKAAGKKVAKTEVAKSDAAQEASEPAGRVVDEGKPPQKPAAPPKPVKMTAFVKKQRQRLLDLRDELMDAMYGVQQETLRNGPSGSEASGSGMHQGDAGSDAYDRDFALNLLSKEQDALQEIEAALQRISEGRYGICEISGKKIPQARLEAIPFARLTVECQSQWEQQHPNRQFRSADALGFLGPNGNSPLALDVNAN